MTKTHFDVPASSNDLDLGNRSGNGQSVADRGRRRRASGSEARGMERGLRTAEPSSASDRNSAKRS